MDKDNNMERVGDDLYFYKDILLSEALCGLSFTFKHPNQSQYTLEFDDVITPDMILKVDDLGFYNKNSNKYGKLVINPHIVFPTSLNQDRKDLIKKLIPKRHNDDNTGNKTFKLKSYTKNSNQENKQQNYSNTDYGPGVQCAQQ